MAGNKPMAASNTLSGGSQKRLSSSAAGWLLLSTLPAQKSEAMIRRMRAEAGTDNKFDVSELIERVRECGQRGYAIGPAGFGATTEMCTVLMPRDGEERPMAVGLVYEPNRDIDPHALIGLLQKSSQGCASLDNAVSLRGNETGIAVVA